MNEMRAATVVSPGTIRLDRVAKPAVQANEVRIRLEGTGVCASNLANWQGTPWTQYPMEPGAMGHEGWGQIDAVGSAVVGLKPGDRVAALSYKAYAEFDVAQANAVVKLPTSLAQQPFPGEALGCAMNIFRRADIHAGQTVAIVGVGFLGTLLTQLATNAGAHVIAITRREFALAMARRFGARETIPMHDHQTILNQVREITRGEFCDRVIEAVGKQWPLDLAAELTRERGKLVIAGYHQDGPRQVNMQLWNWRGLDVVNAHERDPRVYLEGVRAAVDQVVSGKLDPLPLYTHTYPLEKLGEALDATCDRPDGFMKALVTP